MGLTTILWSVSVLPQLASALPTAPPSHWLYEIKYDGYRMLARWEQRYPVHPQWFDWTARMPALKRDLDQPYAKKALKAVTLSRPSSRGADPVSGIHFQDKNGHVRTPTAYALVASS